MVEFNNKCLKNKKGRITNDLTHLKHITTTTMVIILLFNENSLNNFGRFLFQL